MERPPRVVGVLPSFTSVLPLIPLASTDYGMVHLFMPQGHGVFLPLQKEAAAPLSHLSKALEASHYCLQCKAVISFSTVIKEVKEVGGKCEAHIPAAPLPPFILPQLQQGHPERGCRRCGSKDGEKEEDRCKIKALG